MTIGTNSPSASPVKQIETRLGWMYFILREWCFADCIDSILRQQDLFLHGNRVNNSAACILSIHQIRQVIATLGYTRWYRHLQLSSDGTEVGT